MQKITELQENKMSTGQRLQIVRKAKGMTQAQFADYLGVSSRTYTYYETEDRDPPIAVFVKIADQDQYGIEWLVTGAGYEKPENISADVKMAALAALKYLEEDDIHPPPEKTANMIRHLFNYLRANGDITEEYLSDYIDSAK